MMIALPVFMPIVAVLGFSPSVRKRGRPNWNGAISISIGLQRKQRSPRPETPDGGFLHHPLRIYPFTKLGSQRAIPGQTMIAAITRRSKIM